MNDEAARQSRSAPPTTPGGNGNTGDGLQLLLAPAAVEQLVDQVAERVREELAGSSPWLTRQAAAEYLGVPVSRLEKDRTVPTHRWDGRVFYAKDELDGWLRGQ